jgi:hypothetical protein
VRSQVRAEIGPGHTCWLYGPGYVIHPAIRAARSPKQYDPKRRAIAVPRKFLDDVLAALDLQQGVDVQVEQVLV